MTGLEPEKGRAGEGTSFQKARSWLLAALETVVQVKKKYFSRQFAIFLHRLFKRIVRSLARGGSRSFIANIAGTVAETVQERSETKIRGLSKEKSMLLPVARRHALDQIISICKKTQFHNATLNYQGVNAYLCLFYDESLSRSKNIAHWDKLGRLIDVYDLALHHTLEKQGGKTWSMYEICFTDQGKEAKGNAIFQTSGPETWKDAKHFIMRAGVLALLISLISYELLLVVVIALVGLAFIFEKENKK